MSKLTVYKSIMPTEAVKMEDLSRAFQREGFQSVPTGRQIPVEIVQDILNVDPRQRDAVVSRRADFVPLDYRVWRNGNDVVTATDFEIREPEQITYDPFVIVFETVQGRSSNIVKKVLIHELQIDWLKFVISRGATSNLALQCCKELAHYTGKSPEQVFNSYLDSLVSSWTAIAARPIRTLDVQNKSALRKIPMGALPTW